MAKKYIHRSADRVVEATQWNKMGDHNKVIPYKGRKGQGCIVLGNNIHIAVRPGVYVIDIPGTDMPAIMSKSAFEANYKEFNDVR